MKEELVVCGILLERSFVGKIDVNLNVLSKGWNVLCEDGVLLKKILIYYIILYHFFFDESMVHSF